MGFDDGEFIFATFGKTGNINLQLPVHNNVNFIDKCRIIDKIINELLPYDMMYDTIDNENCNHIFMFSVIAVKL